MKAKRSGGWWLVSSLGWVLAFNMLMAQENSGAKDSRATTKPSDNQATTKAEQTPPPPGAANKLKLLVGDNKKVVWTELAVTPAQQQKGLMFRTQMGEDEGMLFVYQKPWRPSVWMKNTILPLSCAFLDSQGRILEIKDLVSLSEKAVSSSYPQVRFMLEVNRGWFSDNGIEAGAVVRTERGPLLPAFGLR